MPSEDDGPESESSDWRNLIKDTGKKEKKASPKGQPERLPSSDELEAEWQEKMDKASKSGKKAVKSSGKSKRADSLKDVFKQLKEEEVTTASETGEGSKRLDRIGGTIKGAAPELRERELTGEKVSGIYRLHPLGTLPPLNLLSRAFYNLGANALERDLKRSDVNLYPEEYCAFSSAMGFILALLVFAVFFLVITPFQIILSLLAFALSLVFASLLIANLPSIRLKSGSREVDRQLPFALRHMSALLSAGISIFDSMVSVSKADYGLLSKELDKVVWDVKSGENFAEALEDASGRIGSTSFTRVTIHIRRALQMGGDVAKIISQIADDLTFEMRMKISDFVEKLNAFAIVYLIGGIVGPVVMAVFAVVSSAKPLQEVGGGAVLDPTMLAVLVLLMFPLIMIVITYTVKLMEPKV